MANQTDNDINDFKVSGPSHLTPVNWQDERYRRSVIASLVKGVYVLKSDHRKHLALAPPWWESFHFKLLRYLTDEKDYSIFGAVYEYIPEAEGAPKYVIAFRGTMVKHDSYLGDMKLNMNVLLNKLHRRSRFKIAMKAVEKMVSEKGDSSIWLAGHSLGASIAMIVGKTMAKEGILLETYLYNPPFIAFPVELIPGKIVRHGILVTRTLVIAGLAAVLQSKKDRQQSADLFATLSQWLPKLFLNASDFICSEYIAYFEHREMLESCGVGVLANFATRHSMQGLLFNFVGKDNWSEEKSHLIPSACVTTSCHPNAHFLSQWFTDDSVSDPKEYRYKTNKAPLNITET
ncbi:hypothetical protein MKW94_017620 [Papaver nudicaule]|uniref:Fungal lipase-type domain-containing protein n=1 Tax=Papaver nudicaule TaxID=74823 RepID=A0AA41SI16_PAPNU|nr:hypothetical protein [Papaver nudicaule]